MGAQDGAVLGNMVNTYDGSLSVNNYGMNHNTRISYDEILIGDKTYNVWEDLGRPIYFEVTITCAEFYQVTLLGEKDWADQTESKRTQASLFCFPEEKLFIYDEEFTRILIETCEECTDGVLLSIYASGFIPDGRGVNQYRTKIDMNIK